MSEYIKKLKKQRRVNSVKSAIYVFVFAGCAMGGVVFLMFSGVIVMGLIETSTFKSETLYRLIGFLSVGLVLTIIAKTLLPHVWGTQNKDKLLEDAMELVEEHKNVQPGAMSLSSDPASDGGLSQVQAEGGLCSVDSNESS